MLIILQFKSSLITSNSARTGSYIALDALCREGDRKGGINVPIDVTTSKDGVNLIQGDVSFSWLIYPIPKCISLTPQERSFHTVQSCMYFIDFEASVS
ncbi:hypothetical protein MHBO_004559 [Bonamia ostreae]|uniref:Uncharacterized protein n=1 Tax=Bonamia ostreae TaxID=126728 RepID=A0ABV2ATN6_9EUKA